MRKLSLLAGLTLALALVAGAYALVGKKGDDGGARLTGYAEVPANSTTGAGEFRLEVNTGNQRISYRLTYRALEADASQAHIHFAQPNVNGGVAAFLCGGSGKPACPAREGTVTGTIVPADVVGPEGQGIAPGEFNELVRAIRAGKTYANVHTAKFPGGEIRGQIRGGNGDNDDDKKKKD